MTDLASQLLELLKRRCYGRASAVRAANLAVTLGTSWRHVAKAVEELRNAGIFVASARTRKPRGLYLPATEAERHNALGSFRRATITQITTYNRLKRARRLRVTDGDQPELFPTHHAPLTTDHYSTVSPPAAADRGQRGA